MGAKEILRLTGLVKRFGDLTALNQVSLVIERGKLVTFLGPSGCGKTTLLRIISGFSFPDEGEVVLDGEDITQTPPNVRDTAMVFQNYALFPHLTVAQNIAFGLKIMKKPKKKIEDEVERLLNLVQMEGLGERRPHALSGGQQQRVALARALSLEPKILLLDEPLSNLDANLRILMRGEIRKLHRRLGITIIFVTHDQEEAMSLSDELIVMDRGVVRQVASPVEIYETPADEFVARFIGQINFLPGYVTAVMPEGMILTTEIGELFLAPPDFPAAPGARLAAVVRPESVGIARRGAKPPEEGMNVIPGRVEAAMYLGFLMRYTVRCKDMSIQVDEPDPRYNGIFDEGSEVDLYLRRRVHLLSR